MQAWYRRGKLNTVLGNYQDAIRDITVSISLASSLAGKKQLRSELEAIPDYQNKHIPGNDEHHPSNYGNVGEIFLLD